MADVKISQLPSATVPVAGTEVLPIVQNSETRKVAISNLTAGRAVAASSLALNGASIGSDALAVTGTAAFSGIASFNSSAYFSSGAISAPSIAHSGDTNTGFYFPTNDSVAGVVNGAEGFRFNTTGFCIGGSPSYPFQVSVVGAGTNGSRGISFAANQNVSDSVTTYGFLSFNTYNKSSGGSGTFYSHNLQTRPIVTAGATGGAKNVAVINDLSGSYSGTLSELTGINITDTILTSFGGTLSITQSFGLNVGNVSAVTTGLTISAGYAVYIANQTGATASWAIFSEGGNSSHAGNFSFGTNNPPTVAVDVTGAVLATTNITSKGATAGVGYSTGAGSAVAQGTSRTTGVTINNVCGAITLVSAAGSTTPTSFTVTNSAVAATDIIILSQKSGTDKYHLLVTAVAAGSFEITFYTTGGTTTETPVINFSVIKAVTA